MHDDNSDIKDKLDFLVHDLPGAYLVGQANIAINPPYEHTATREHVYAYC